MKAGDVVYSSQCGDAVVAIRLRERRALGPHDVDVMWLVDVMRIEDGWAGYKVVVTETVFPGFALYTMRRSPR